MAETRKFHCISCHKNVTATTDNHYRKHDREKGTECSRSRRDIPAWLIRRGPETGPEDERPVIGRDYAPCPLCPASPVLDGATGCFTKHTHQGETPTSPRVPCDMSGKPYESGESECPTTGVPASTAKADAVPNESEEMISKWAATARAIEDRELPPPSPESTTTPKDSPQRPDAAETPPAVTPSGDASSATPSSGSQAIPEHLCHRKDEHKPHKWMNGKRQAQCAGKPAPRTARTEPAPASPSAEDAAPASEAAPSSTSSSRSERGIAAVEKLSRKPAPTPDGTPADSAAPTPADAPEAATREVQKALPGATVEYDATPVPVLRNAAATPTTAAAPSTAATPTTPAAAPPSSSLFAQPGSPFSQPGKVAVAEPAVPMTVMAERLVARMREVFYSYGNRRTDDNRGAQSTLGPSEIGSPCDRRLAMSLLRIPPVNPGGDGWASFKGTAIHAALAEVFTWADGGTGRFAVEVPLAFPSDLVPRGTTDLLDRVLFMVDDHKIQGKWSQDRLRTKGMTPTQRAQLHVYGYGARLQGERVDHVALLSWPMESSTLDDLYAVVEPYDPQIARDALARVDRIAAEIETRRDALNRQHIQPLEVAALFPVDPESCKFCDWYAPGDPNMERGCPGR
ncbi:hypothetical protein [Streptomyces atriruber]|uniref:hypothetical protein n=1 Tax=Streptomyces atriruber TaxID=545121 RepID=UPI000A6AEDC6|nr:hypothetical protein [Streptomyces atriruber]